MTITEVRAILRVCDLDKQETVLLLVRHRKPRLANIEILPDRPGVKGVKGKVIKHQAGSKRTGGGITTVEVNVELMRQWVRQMEQVQ